MGNMPSRYVSRRKNDLVQPRPHLTMYKNGAYYMAIQIYNHLPNTIKTLQGRKFEIELRKLLVNKTFYNLKEYFNERFKLFCIH